MKIYIWTLIVIAAMGLYSLNITSSHPKNVLTLQELPSLDMINANSYIRSITFTPANKAFILSPVVQIKSQGSTTLDTNRSAIFESKELLGKAYLYNALTLNDKYDAIHVTSDSLVFLLNPNKLMAWTPSSGSQIPIPKSDFTLEESDSFLRIIGKDSEHLWITYKKNNTIVSRLFRYDLIEGSFFASSDLSLVLGKDIKPYRCIAQTRSGDDTWALSSNGKTFYKLDIFGKNVEDIDISEDDDATFQLDIPLDSIYVYDFKHIFGLDAKGMIYQWNSDKKQFFTIQLPKGLMPINGYISLASAFGERMYAVHKDGKVYTVKLDNPPTIHHQEPETPAIENITEKEEIKETPTASEAPVGPAAELKQEQLQVKQKENTYEPSLETQAQSIIPVGTKAGQILHIAQTIRPIKPQEVTPTKQERPVNTPSETKPTIPIKQTPSQAHLTGWGKIGQERQEASYDAGFGAGFMAGILANTPRDKLIAALNASYQEGINDGPKTCILDKIGADLKSLYWLEVKQGILSKIPGASIFSK